jgi:transcriptional regulator with XRE-family HTH domain
MRSAGLDFSEREAIRSLLGRLREQRLARNWSQSEMANRCGLSRASYQNLETGHANVTLLNLVRVLGVLNCLDRFADVIPTVAPQRTLETPERKKRQRASALTNRGKSL